MYKHVYVSHILHVNNIYYIHVYRYNVGPLASSLPLPNVIGESLHALDSEVRAWMLCMHVYMIVRRMPENAMYARYV